jgi:NTP pyrophosphatase (non-canonical NTP hydrolase)
MDNIHDGEVSWSEFGKAWRANCLPCDWSGPKRSDPKEATADLRNHEQGIVPQLTLDDYQEVCTTFAVYPGQGSLLGLAYAALGLNGEAGETAEQIKKTWRDDGIEDPANFTLSDERRQKIIKELGDTLWYASQIATEIGVSLGDIAQANIDKLSARRAGNLIHGEGSDR